MKLKALSTAVICAVALAAPAALANDYITTSTNDWLRYTNTRTQQTVTAQIAQTQGNWRMWSEFAGMGATWLYTASGYDYVWVWNGNNYSLIADLSGPVGESRQVDFGNCNRGTVRIASRGSLTTGAGSFSDVVKITLQSTCADAGTGSIWFAKGVGVVKWTEQSIMGEQTFECTAGLVGGRSLGTVPTTPTTPTTSSTPVPPTEHAQQELILWGCNDSYLVVETYRDAWRGLHGSGVTNEVIVASNYAASQLRYEMSQANVPMDEVDVLVAPVDSVWMRDYGPIIAKASDGTRSIVDFDYFPNRPRDNDIPVAYANYRGWSRKHVALSYEGGNFATDGRGTVFCSNGVKWFNDDKTTSQITSLFRSAGCDRVEFFEPLIDEGTTHCDMFLRIMDDGVALVSDYPSSHRQKAVTNAAAAKFRSLGYRVVQVTADNSYDEYASYTNSVLANGIALVPQYRNATKNRAALQAYESLGYRAIGIEAQLIIKYSGATHCVSMQVPTGR